jgi:hypothetical protein
LFSSLLLFRINRQWHSRKRWFQELKWNFSDEWFPGLFELNLIR